MERFKMICQAGFQRFILNIEFILKVIFKVVFKAGSKVIQLAFQIGQWVFGISKRLNQSLVL